MRRLTTAWMIIALLAAPALRAEEHEKSRLYKTLGFALIGTSAGEAWSTEWALRSADVREANPLMATNTEARLALKISTTALVFVGSDYAHSKGHTRAALWLRIACVAGYGYATLHNLRTAGALR